MKTAPAKKQQEQNDEINAGISSNGIFNYTRSVIIICDKNRCLKDASIRLLVASEKRRTRTMQYV